MLAVNVDSFHRDMRGYCMETKFLAEHDVELVLSSLVGEEQLVAGASHADIVLVEHPDTPVTERVVQGWRSCRLIVKCAVGIDNIDVKAASRCGILVAHIPNYCVEEVSDHAVALILSCFRRLFHFDRHVRAGGWNDIGFSVPIRRVNTRKVGLLGFGRIARRVADKVSALTSEILVHDPQVSAEVFQSHRVREVSFADLLGESDVLSLHLPLTETTEKMIGWKELSALRSHCFVVNTSRGRIIDEDALVQAVASGVIGGAALDVAAHEPLERMSELRTLPNVIVTPHFGAYSVEAVEELRATIMHTVAAFAQGFCPPFAANPEIAKSQGLRPYEEWQR